jgi:uncharacterized membrane protein
VRYDFAGIAHYTSDDVHPPLYYFLLKIWTLIFGGSLSAIRAFSTFFGALSIVSLYILIKNFISKKYDAFKITLVLLLVALSPIFLFFATQARMYSMNVFLSLVSILLVLRIKQSKKIENWHWISYTLVVVVMMYTHYYLALVILAEIIWLIIIKKRELVCPKLAVSIAGAVVAYIPWIPSLLRQVDSFKKGSWQPKSTLTVFSKFLNDVFFFFNSPVVSYDGAPAIYEVFGIVFVLVILILGLKFTRTKFTYLLFLLIVVPLVFCYITNMLIARYMLTSIICLFLLAGITMFSSGNFLKFIPVVLLICVLPLGYPKLFTVGGNGASSATIQGLKEVQPGEVVLAEDVVRYMDFAVYQSDSLEVYVDTQAHNEHWSSLEMVTDKTGEYTVYDYDKFLKEHEKVLVVYTDKIQHFVNGKPVE